MLSMGLIAVAAISLFAYVSLTLAVVFATAGRTKAVASVNAHTSRIGELEERYLSLTNVATASEASSRGFVAPKKVTLAPLQTPGASLSIRTR